MKGEWNTVMNITGLHFVFFMMKRQQSFVNQKVIFSTLVSQFNHNNRFAIHYIILSTGAAIYEDERYGTAGLIGDFNTFVCNWQATESSLAECNLKVTSSCTVQECATEYGMQCFGK